MSISIHNIDHLLKPRSHEIIGQQSDIFNVINISNRLIDCHFILVLKDIRGVVIINSPNFTGKIHITEIKNNPENKIHFIFNNDETKFILGSSQKLNLENSNFVRVNDYLIDTVSKQVLNLNDYTVKTINEVIPKIKPIQSLFEHFI